MKIFYRLILLFVLLSFFSVHSFAKKKETKAQTPPVLDGIWEIKFGDSIDTVKQKMSAKGASEPLSSKKVGYQLSYRLSTCKKKFSYEALLVDELKFGFDENLEKLQEIYIDLKPKQQKLGTKESSDKFMPEYVKKYDLKFIRDTRCQSEYQIKSDGTKILFYRDYGYDFGGYFETSKCKTYSITLTDLHSVYEFAEKVSESRNAKIGVTEGFRNIKFGDSNYLIEILLEDQKIYRYGHPKSMEESTLYYKMEYIPSRDITYGNMPISSIDIIFNDKNEAVGYKIYFAGEHTKENWTRFCDLVEYIKEAYSFELIKEIKLSYVTSQYYISTTLCGMEILFEHVITEFYYAHGKSLMIKGKAMIQDELMKKLDELQKEQNEYNKMKNDL